MGINPITAIGISCGIAAGIFVSCQGRELNKAKAQLGSKETEVVKCLADIEAQNNAVDALQMENAAHVQQNEARSKAIKSERKIAISATDLASLNEKWSGI